MNRDDELPCSTGAGSSGRPDRADQAEDVLAEGFREMARDARRERGAEEWIEGLIGDVADAPTESDDR
jgi:hypothetical protein